MNDRTRNIHYGTGFKCDNPKWGKKTKINGKSTQWYRFQAPAGNKMPDKPPNHGHGERCGTTATTYLSGGHPTKAGQVVSRKVCFNYAGKYCPLSRNVKVTHCGAFFVYQLPYAPGCNYRYCAEKK